MDNRAIIANELDRRDFWKKNFLIALELKGGVNEATAIADRALVIYEQKFGGVVKVG